MLLKKTLKTSKEKYKESFLIVVYIWNRDLMLILERPLSHYWTSPLSLEVTFQDVPGLLNCEYLP